MSTGSSLCMTLSFDPNRRGHLSMIVSLSRDASSPLAMPLHRRLHPLRKQSHRKVRADDILAELLLLQKLEHLERRRGKRQVLEVGRARPVLQVVEVGDEGGVREKLAGSEVVEILRVRERLDKLPKG